MNSVLTRIEPREKSIKKHCVHHWIIDPPEGPVSKGVCKYCGAESDFLNYVPDLPWSYDRNDDTGFLKYGRDVDFDNFGNS